MPRKGKVPCNIKRCLRHQKHAQGKVVSHRIQAMTSKSSTRLPLLRKSWIDRCVNGVFPLLLALMVLGWGTGYKLSLYHSHATRAATPAKLCTRASDMAKSELDRAATRTVVEHRTPLWAVLVVSGIELFPTLRREEDGSGLVPKASPSRFSPASYRRPPPAHLSPVG